MFVVLKLDAEMRRFKVDGFQPNARNARNARITLFTHKMLA